MPDQVPVGLRPTARVARLPTPRVRTGSAPASRTSPFDDPPADPLGLEVRIRRGAHTLAGLVHDRISSNPPARKIDASDIASHSPPRLPSQRLRLGEGRPTNILPRLGGYLNRPQDRFEAGLRFFPKALRDAVPASDGPRIDRCEPGRPLERGTDFGRS